MNTAYVLLRTGYADWEAASALAELRRTFGFAVKTIGLAAETVVSMGGLKVMPDLPLAALFPNQQIFSFSPVVSPGRTEKHLRCLKCYGPRSL
jgi:hypothetical protein